MTSATKLDWEKEKRRPTQTKTIAAASARSNLVLRRGG
jgi:hypothetical protein